MTTSQDLKYAKEKYLQYITESNDIWNELYVIPAIQRQSFFSDTQESEVVKLSEIVRTNECSVILGDPGSGKTTLLRFLEYQFARNLLRNPDRAVLDNFGNDYGMPRLPIFLSAANLAGILAKNPRASFVELVFSNFKNFQVANEMLQKVLEITFENGEALILLDGLDEITDSSSRLGIRQKIEEFTAARHVQTHLVMTSRVVGYGSSASSSKFSHYVIREMERSQIEMFIRNFLAQNSDIEMVLKVVDENPAVGRLASSPLMLFMLIQIFVRDGSFPSNRAQLYQKAVEVMLRRTEMSRELSVYPTVDSKVALDLFRLLAYWVFENKPGGLVSRIEIRKLLEDFLVSSEIVKSAKDVADFFEWILLTGILVESSPGIYGFSHLSFQEFFVAIEILRKEDLAVELIYRHRGDDRWLEPILLAVAFEKMQNPKRATELLRAAVLPEHGRYGKEVSEADSEDEYEKEYKEILNSYKIFAALQHEDKQLREMAVKLHHIGKEQKMPKKVFISYNHHDRKFVEKLANDLTKEGVTVWWDEWEINVGESIFQKVSDGIKTSAYLAVVLSPASVQSNWVNREVGSATMRQLSEKRSITILPLLVTDCEIPVLLAEIKWADFRSDYKFGLKNLLKTLL